jgi:hypothetical protein
VALLKFKKEVPPLGFWYIQPQSHLRIEGDSLKETAEKVIAHRKYKGFEPTDYPTVALEVERQICSRLGTFHCQPEKGEKTWTPIQMERRRAGGLRHLPVQLAGESVAPAQRRGRLERGAETEIPPRRELLAVQRSPRG